MKIKAILEATQKGASAAASAAYERVIKDFCEREGILARHVSVQILTVLSEPDLGRGTGPEPRPDDSASYLYVTCQYPARHSGPSYHVVYSTDTKKPLCPAVITYAPVVFDQYLMYRDTVTDKLTVCYAPDYCTVNS